MDINCDMGEGMSNEKALMAYVDSCNIACGGHAGDVDSMIQTLKLAKKHKVKIGAHPSFVDSDNFGRKVMEVPRNVLKSQLIAQIGTLRELANAEGTELHHVKAHGALYNEAARSKHMAGLLIEVIEFFKDDLCIFVPCRSVIADEVKRLGIKHWNEVFADRNYNDHWELLPRTDPHAVVMDAGLIEERVTGMIRNGKVMSATGTELPIEFDTICVHGDHPKALEILKILHNIKMSEY